MSHETHTPQTAARHKPDHTPPAVGEAALVRATVVDTQPAAGTVTVAFASADYAQQLTVAAGIVTRAAAVLLALLGFAGSAPAADQPKACPCTTCTCCQARPGQAKATAAPARPRLTCTDGSVIEQQADGSYRYVSEAPRATAPAAYATVSVPRFNASTGWPTYAPAAGCPNGRCQAR